MKKTYLNTLKPEDVIKRLKDGEVIHIEESTGTIKMIDSVIVKNYKLTTTFNCSIVVDDTDDVYFEEEEKFEIKETGLYKTRCGQKVFISKVDELAFGVVDGQKTTTNWYLTGKLSVSEITELDIVSKWED